jgi:hypothetical protein
MPVAIRAARAQFPLPAAGRPTQPESSMSFFRHQAPRALLGLLLILAALLIPSSAWAAGPPQISATSFSKVTDTSAILEATLSPNGAKTFPYHFLYVDQASYEESGFAEAKATPDGEALNDLKGPPVPVSATLSDLAPVTIYHFRLFAHNAKGNTEGPELTFSTLAPPPTFGPCENDAFRVGAHAPPGRPSASLPDCRAYEQASPIDKNGNDIVGDRSYAHASVEGNRVSFQSNAPLPQGESSQSFKPAYLATRGPGGWSTSGLLPPQSAGENAHIAAWTPDFAHVFDWAYKLGEPRIWTLIERSSLDGSITPIVPPRTAGIVNEVGPGVPAASTDGRVVFFESEGSPFVPGAAEGENRPSLYAWDRETGQVRLAGSMNTQAETEALLPKGSIAGLRTGLIEPSGAGNFARERRAANLDGSSVYFTAVDSSQLYRRLNPTEPQSPLDGEGNCTDPALACTYHVSATEKTNGQGSSTPADPGGPQAAEFMAATADGEEAFFISSEKLTNDANTGPEQPEAEIGRATVGLGPEEAPSDVREPFLLAHALGMAVSPDGSHIYWVNPPDRSIGRATLDPAACAPLPAPCEIEPEYILPGPALLEDHPYSEPGVEHETPATPRYVAAGACAEGGECVYWTNTGLTFEETANGSIEDRTPHGGSTIGRATIDPETGEPTEVSPAFIEGASDPQGMAVNLEHLYWTNEPGGHPTIGRADLDGGEVQQSFFIVPGYQALAGLALDPEYVNFASNEVGNDYGSIFRIPLEGSTKDSEGITKTFGHVVGKAGIRGIAVEGSHVYWATLGEGVIGRANLDLGEASQEWLKPAAPPFGLAAGPESHIYFSVNGEAQPNPGADLYRYSATSDAEGHHLTDLTADAADEDGAEVRSVLGASADGAYVYFVANAVLSSQPNAAGKVATPGDCHGDWQSEVGACNLYLHHAGQVSFIARLNAGDDRENWRRGLGTQIRMPIARLAPDGRALLFAASERLTAYDNHGAREYYLFRPGRPLACVTCNPVGNRPQSTAVSQAPQLAADDTGAAGFYPYTSGPVFSNNLSASGERVFFQSGEALVGGDKNSLSDAYEWEAPGAGSCTESSSAFYPQNEGCLYLLGPGGAQATYLLDADAEGGNAFILTGARLVGQDQDQLQDVYDARIGGGLASQAPPPSPPVPCEGEACKLGAPSPSPSPSPVTSVFQGGGNVHEKGRRCPKGRRAVGRKGKTRCVKRDHLKPPSRHNRKHDRNRRAHR